MWYIFNKDNKCIASIDYEADISDLESRGEFAIYSEITYEDYTRLFFKNEKIIILEPTAEEIQAQKEAELEQEYNTQLESFKNDMLVALLNNNDDAIKSIQEEIIEFNAAYVEAKEEIKGDAE